MQQSRTTVKSLLHHLQDFKWNELCFRSINRTWNPHKSYIQCSQIVDAKSLYIVFQVFLHICNFPGFHILRQNVVQFVILTYLFNFNHIYHPFPCQKFIIQMSLTWKIKYKKNVIEGATCLSCLLKRWVKAPPIFQPKAFLLYKSLAFLRCLVGTKKFDLLFLWPSKSYKKWKDATYCLKLPSKVSTT